MKMGTGRGYQLYKAYLGDILDYQVLDLNAKDSCVKRLPKADYLSKADIDYIFKNSLWGDQSSKVVMDQAIARFGIMDVIVDDGSHYPRHQIASFEYLFEKMLKPGGIYVVEDIQTSFLPTFEGTKELQLARKSFIEFVKDLILQLTFVGTPKAYINAVPTTPHPIVRWIRTIDCAKDVCAFMKRYEELEMPKNAANT